MKQKPIVHKKDLRWWELLYIPQIIAGLKITISQIFRPKYTFQYPEEKWIPTGAFRGRPVLVEENGIERCVACGLCSRVCPALAIEVQASETNLQKERYPVLFEINMLRCIFCGFCEEVCPEEAIVMSKDYELTFTSQEDGIFGKEKLLVNINELKDRLEYIRQHH
mgnify:FL=1